VTDALPPGWTLAPLGQVAELQLGKMLDKARNTSGTELPYLRNINVRWGEITTEKLATMRFSDAEAKKFAITDGDVLVCEGGEPGRAAIWSGGPTSIKFQKAIHRVRPGAKLTSNWISLFLRHAAATGALFGHFTGTTIQHLPGQALAAIPLPLPPLAEQRRIVARIEALFARTRRARMDLERIAFLSRRHRDRVLATAFDGEWPEVPVSTIAIAMFDGPFGSNLKSNDYTDEGTRVVRLENIGHLRFIESKRTYISNEKGATLSRHRLQPRDLLFSSFVDKEVRVCLFPEDLDEDAINKADCFCVRCDEAKCDPKFLAMRLASPVTYEQVREAVHGATRPRIGMSDLKTYRIPLPPLADQQTIVARIQVAHAAAERAAHDADRALTLLGHLERSILTRAFRGELVPQNPADAPSTGTQGLLRPSTTEPRRRHLSRTP
jgi:type I restriction enzyme S subunit